MFLFNTDFKLISAFLFVMTFLRSKRKPASPMALTQNHNIESQTISVRASNSLHRPPSFI